MQKDLYEIRAYNIKHNYNVTDFLEAYRLLLQKAIDEIWSKIVWVEEYNKEGKRRLIPSQPPKDKEFKHHYLRNLLMKDWNYSKHYVDSAIKQAYSIIKSWRRSYIKGDRTKNKPIARKRFVRIKETLYSFRNGKIIVSIKPNKQYLEFDISKAWFLSRARGNIGELILNEKYLTITFRAKKEKKEMKGKIAWDCNEKSLDGFNPEIGWIKIDLTKLFHIHRVYELKRKGLQQKSSKKQSIKKVLAKYSKREKNRAKDFIHKLTTQISKEFKDFIHGFEDLRKQGMLNYSKEHNRRIATINWRTITSFLGYKSNIMFLDPKNSTKTCSRCGKINASKGAVYECKSCGLRIDRQLNAAINLYLKMEGLSPSQKLFDELMKAWSGFALTGEKADEGFDELERSPRLVNPKSYACLSKTT
jgi:putative transposase